MVHIVGLRPGAPILSEAAQKALLRTKVVVGGKRLLGALALAAPHDSPFAPERQIPITGSLDTIVRDIKAEAHRGVTVLADGDPLFFGIGERLINDLGPENVVIHPCTTTLQVAASRLCIPWNDIETVSLHGRDDFGPLFSALSRNHRVAVFTDAQNSPEAIAQVLLEKGAEGMTMTVLEDLETPQERIRRLTPEQVWDLEFSPLNIVIVERSYPPEIGLHLGVPDHFYMHEKGLITKQAVRCAGLGMLNILPDSTVWDLGSGCGSVAIEASHLAYSGRVYAVEQHARRASMIRENIRRFGALVVEAVNDDMPECLDYLPDPDRIFIGGGLGGDKNKSNDLMKSAGKRLKPGGKMVVHCILLETLLRAKTFMQEQNWLFGVTQLQASTSDRLAGDLRFKAQNPVFILWAEKSSRNDK